jgi:hypothetical protein
MQKYGQCGKGTVASSRLTPEMLSFESLQITQKFFSNCRQHKKICFKADETSFMGMALS